MVTKVRGGVLNSQMLKGKLRFFKIEGAANCFQYTMGTDSAGDGTGEPNVVIPGTTVNHNTAGTTVYSEKVGIGQPVPNSVADVTLRKISEKCTISIIRVVSTNELHMCIESNNNGWDTSEEGPYSFTTGLDTNSDAKANMEAALAVIGTIEGVPTTAAGGKTFDFDTNGDGTGTSTITITEVPFILA